MKKIYQFFIKLWICCIIFLVLAILSKTNLQYKEKIKKYLYQDHLDFSLMKDFYHHYLGGIFPLTNITKYQTNYVFNEKITYQEIEPYQEGAMLKVSKNYLVPNSKEGIVVYLGKKEKYGYTVIIEGDNQVDYWYGNICNIMVKMYDQVPKGSYLGESCDEKIYFVVTKKNKTLNYQDYLKDAIQQP